jgi:PHD/YefM family antitoxin component YafN of YafNO toxin-antitoxin module
MIEVPATEFAKNFGRYKELAQRESVAITSHGRTSGYFVSEQEYAEYQRLRAHARRAYHISELPETAVAALTEARMNPKHDHLNTLLDD